MARTQRSIQSFARVSKAFPTDGQTSKKRKQFDEEVSSSLAPAVQSSKKMRLQLETPPETPTKVIKRALADLNIAVPAPPAFKSTKRKRGASPDGETLPTPSESDDDFNSTMAELPSELNDLTRLNSAFLTALSLHYAHHGTSSPIDTRTLTPSITKIWGKRKVTLEDIRLCLGVVNLKPTNWRVKSLATFTLAKYANGKVCIELNAQKKRRGVLSQSFDEKSLNRRFADRLEEAWNKWAAKTDVTAFTSSLPLMDVPNSASFHKVAPLLAKGQQRLEEVMRPKANNEQSLTPQFRQKRRKVDSAEPQAAIDSSTTAPQTSNAQTESTIPDIEAAEAGLRSLGLIERIRQKELYKSTLPAPPTKAELERIAALQRAEELLGILDLLAVGKSAGLRVSFPLPALVQSVQNSIRSPMSREEIENCLNVLAKDIAVGYIGMSAFGSMKCVVVNKALKLYPEEIKARLAENGIAV